MSYGFKMLKRPICEDIPRFPPGHAWMEPLHHFWRRVADLLACDGPEGHTGPPCLVVPLAAENGVSGIWI
jgi:hypothetical protein